MRHQSFRRGDRVLIIKEMATTLNRVGFIQFLVRGENPVHGVGVRYTDGALITYAYTEDQLDLIARKAIR